MTNALGPGASLPLVDVGFAVRGRLHLLVHDLDRSSAGEPPDAPSNARSTASTSSRPTRPRSTSSGGSTPRRCAKPCGRRHARTSGSRRDRMTIGDRRRCGRYGLFGRAAATATCSASRSRPRPSARGSGARSSPTACAGSAPTARARAFVNTQEDNDRALALYLRSGSRNCRSACTCWAASCDDRAGAVVPHRGRRRGLRSSCRPGLPVPRTTTTPSTLPSAPVGREPRLPEPVGRAAPDVHDAAAPRQPHARGPARRRDRDQRLPVGHLPQRVRRGHPTTATSAARSRARTRSRSRRFARRAAQRHGHVRAPRLRRQPLLRISQPGVYPVEVQLVNTGVASGSFVTWLVAVDTSSPHPVERSSRWRSSGSRRRTRHAARRLGRPRSCCPDEAGRAARQDRDAARARGRFPYSLVVGPETAETWKRLAKTDHAYAGGYARLRAAVARPTTEVLPAPYVPIDDAPLEAAGLGDNLPAQYTAGAAALRSSLSVTPAARAVGVPRSGRATPPSTGCGQCWSIEVAVRDEALIPVTHPFTPGAGVRARHHGRQVARRLDRAVRRALFNGRDPAAVTAERVVAALAEVAYETPSIARGMVVAPPARWKPDLATMTTRHRRAAHAPAGASRRRSTTSSRLSRTSRRKRSGSTSSAGFNPSSPSRHRSRPYEYNATVAELAAYRDVVGRTTRSSSTVNKP